MSTHVRNKNRSHTSESRKNLERKDKENPEKKSFKRGGHHTIAFHENYKEATSKPKRNCLDGASS